MPGTVWLGKPETQAVLLFNTAGTRFQLPWECAAVSSCRLWYCHTFTAVTCFLFVPSW